MAHASNNEFQFRLLLNFRHLTHGSHGSDVPKAAVSGDSPTDLVSCSFDECVHSGSVCKDIALLHSARYPIYRNRVDFGHRPS
jgi:hypothetical protein